ncbi:MAG: hypothetical protein DRP11_00435 [Candidatus Aenigmatarchaeota archaeon]|nr:MAG: hypothetical protein DRP11_00435 [Candidatus Aenigmarchaeota archaeon]
MKGAVDKLIELHELLHRLREDYDNLSHCEALVELDEKVLSGEFGELDEEEYREREEELKSHRKMLSDVEEEIRKTRKRIHSLMTEIIQELGGEV